MCQHAPTWAVSNQPHFLAIYRSTLIILYTLLASSYSDCLIACLELILTTIFGLLFNLVSLDCWVPALNNALEAVLWDINNPWCRQLALFKWLSSPSSLLIPTLDPFVSDLLTLPRLAWSGLSTSVTSDSGHVCGASRVSCHLIWILHNYPAPLTPPTLSWLTAQEWALSSQAGVLIFCSRPASNNYNGGQDYKLLRH